MVDTSELEAQKVYERLTKDPECWWVTIAQDTSSAKPKAIINATGDTGVEGIKQYLYDDQVLFGAIKVLGVDTKGAVTSTRQKIIFFSWSGPQVPKLKVAKSMPLKAGLQSYFQGHHVALEVYDKAALNESDIEGRLRACGGAHAPDKYEFGSGSKVTAVAREVEPSSPAASAPAPAPTPAPAPAPVASFPKAVAVSSPSAAPSPAPAAAADEEPMSKPKGRAADNNMFGAFSEQRKTTSGAGAAPVAAAAAGHKGGDSHKDSLAAVRSLGRAASALQALIDGAGAGGSVSAADLQRFVAHELGEAAVRAAAALASAGDA